jgi:septation ring formation regulator EzrA
MDKDQANSYIADLTSGKIKLSDPAEQQLLAHFLEVHKEILESGQRYDQLQAELAQLRSTLTRTEGKREAFADLLISAEVQRQNKLDQSAKPRAASFPQEHVPCTPAEIQNLLNSGGCVHMTPPPPPLPES